MPSGQGLMPPSHEGAQSPRHQPTSPIDPYAQQPGKNMLLANRRTSDATYLSLIRDFCALLYSNLHICKAPLWLSVV